MRQATYDTNLSVPADPNQPQQRGPSKQLHGRSEGGERNLAALREMAAPSDSDGSDDVGGTLETTALRSQNIAHNHGVEAATNVADAKEAEEAEFDRMEYLWIRVQELEVEYALLGKLGFDWSICLQF